MSKSQLIDPAHFGVSFSVKQCRAFGLDPRETLDWLVENAGFRRLRLMSYWNEHEKTSGTYNFDELDWQIDRIAKTRGVVTLCLGVRQPRWPENHWPEWAWELPKKERTDVLLSFVKTVVERYKGQRAIISYQLENEALLKNFGRRVEVDRERLVQEFDLVKNLDRSRPVAMSVSDQWGIPVRRPIPDIVGLSYYHVVYNNGYKSAHHYSWLHRWRARYIRLVLRRSTFIHELQLEPWGPKAIWEMPPGEQDKSMSPNQIARNIRLAHKTKLYPVDLWGGEWWYWRLRKHNDPEVWHAVRTGLLASSANDES